MITKSEWIDWTRNPVTKEFVQAVFEKRESLKESWAEGSCDSDMSSHVTMGRIQALKECIDYVLHDFEYMEDLEEETKDD